MLRATLLLIATMLATGAVGQTGAARLDSLQLRIDRLESEVQRLRQAVTEGAQLDSLLKDLGKDATEEAIPEDQRSRRRRVDALLRAITQRPGQLRFNGSLTTSLQRIVAGESDEAVGTASLDIFAHTSFGPHTLIFCDFEAIGGDGLAGALPTATLLNGDAGSTQSTDGFDRLHVREAWAEFSALGEAVTVTAGKIDVTNYFDNNRLANDETSQFFSDAFVNSAALLAPVPSAGLRLRTTLLGRFFVQCAVASQDNSGRRLFDDLYKIASTGFKVRPGTGSEGNLRFYAFKPPTPRSVSGFGLSYDQVVNDVAGVFARWASNDDGLAAASGVESTWSAGAQIATRGARKQRIAAVAYGVVELAGGGKEEILEVYLRQQINTWTFVSPHLQYVSSPRRLTEDATILGLRVQFNF